MKKAGGILMLGVLSMLIFSSVLLAQERDRNGAVEGTFVRLVEQEFNGRGYMGIVIKPHERDEHVTVLVPRQREELWQASRGLQAGQSISISFVSEAGHRWIKGMEAERREVVEEGPEGRRRINVRREVFRPEYSQEKQMEELKKILISRLDNMAREYRMLRAHMKELEIEVRRLRLENEHLRRGLRERFRAESEREREVRVRIQREGREPEEREIRRERDEDRARGERPMSEREREIRVRIQREGREWEERERPRVRDEDRVAKERPMSEREVRRRRVERREAGLPEGMIGFRGVLVGRVLRKLDRGFVLKVEKIDKIWESNRADRPEASVGKELIINIREDEELSERFLYTLQTLKTGERVLVEAFHFEGNRLTVVEQLKKVE